MNWFDRLTVRRTLVVAFGILILFSCTIGVVGIVAVSRMHDTLVALNDTHLNGLYWLEEANKQKLTTSLAAANFETAADASKPSLRIVAMNALAAMHADLEKVRTLIVTPEGAALFDAVVKKSATWEGLAAAAVGKKEPPSGVDRGQFIKMSIAASADARDAFGKLIEYKRRLAVADEVRATASYKELQVLIVVFVLCALVVGIVLAFQIVRRLATQLGGEPAYASAVANRVAAGRLADPILLRANDQTSLLHTLAHMRSELSALVLVFAPRASRSPSHLGKLPRETLIYLGARRSRPHRCNRPPPAWSN